MEHDNVIYTRHPAHDDCCGCINIHETDEGEELVFECNECGLELKRVEIPHV